MRGPYGRFLTLTIVVAAFLVFPSLSGIAIEAPTYRADRLLLKPAANSTEQARQKLRTAHRLRVLNRFDKLGGLEVLQVPDGTSIQKLIADLSRDPTVEFAEPDYVVRTFAAPNDPKYVDFTQWGLLKIQAATGWDVLSSASNVIVAVVDTGVRYTHQDLAANMWTNPADGSHGFNAFTGTHDPNDDNGHGTMVAGVLGAAGNNGIGIAGVAWKVQIMACKSFDSLQAGTISTCIAGLDFARSNHADIVNASWGMATNSLALSNAVFALQQSGILLVAAAGNSGVDVDAQPVYPACYQMDNIISVAYTLPTDDLAPQSNYGATNVNVAAPGGQIYSTFGATDSYYLSLSGSSFAAPYVSGALALLRALHPAESHQQLRARVLVAAEPLSSLAGKCTTGGRLNLGRALAPPITLRPSLSFSGTPTFTVLADPIRTCVVEASTNLVNWSPLITNTTAIDGTFSFTDAPAGSFTSRFYRASAAR